MGTSVVQQIVGGFWLVLLPGPDFATVLQAKYGNRLAFRKISEQGT